MSERLLCHCCNFVSEVFFLLLYAFASLETNVLYNVDLAAKLLSYRLNVLANRYLVILNEFHASLTISVTQKRSP